MKLSCAVHVFDEAEAVVRLVRSSLPFAPLIGEWLVLDHRSRDGLGLALDEIEPELRKLGIRLTRLHESRDFSAQYTFADVRTATIKGCTYPVVAMLDADFILGPVFGQWMQAALERLTATSNMHGLTYAVPCVWDHLSTNSVGEVVRHGRVWVHNRRVRFMWRDAVHYEQSKQGGRWEKLRVAPTRPLAFHLTPVGTHQQRVRSNAVVSVNVKPPERIALRDTMTMFLQDAISKGLEGDWLDNYAVGRARGQGPYPYHKVRLAGWKLNVPNLRLTSGSRVCA
jgi:hypothetical protein